MKKPMNLCASVSEERGNGEDDDVYATRGGGAWFGPSLRFGKANRTEDGFCFGLTNPRIFGSKPKIFHFTKERSGGAEEQEEPVRRHPQG